MVEPHPDIRSLLEIVIERLGHEAVLPDGTQGGIPHVDAAVVDPDGPGFVIAQRLRARSIPTVLTSIFPPERGSFDLDPVAYLVKPFPLDALEHSLTAAVDAARDVCTR